MRPTGYKFTIDLLRVMAGVGVVVIHVLTPFVNYPPFFQSPTYWLANVIDSMARIAVPLFVLISGFLILDDTKDYSTREFMKRRVVRVGIPLLFWSFAYLLWRIFFMHDLIKFQQIPMMFLLSTIYFHLYFLYLIFGLYLITPWLKIFIKKSTEMVKNYFLIFTFIIAAGATFIKGFIYPHIILFPTIFLIFVPYISYYFAGDFFRNFHGHKKILLLSGIFLISFILTVVLNYWYMLHIGYRRGLMLNPPSYLYFFENFSPTVIVMSVSLFLLVLNNRNLEKIKQNRIFTYVHDAAPVTFGVYLIHPMIIDILNKLRVLDLAYIPSPVWVFMIIKLVITLFFSFIVIMLLRKIRLMRYLVG